MNSILQQFESHITPIEGVMDELLPPATHEEIDAAEQELGAKFPEDFRTLYKWHNGDKGNIFLFGEYRISSLSELLEFNRIGRESSCPEWEQVSDESGAFKDCIYNSKWIQFADNGGNTIVLLDMDPGRQGTMGQIIESCDGDTECRFSGIKEFIADITDRISAGQIAWDQDSGCFWETDEESVAKRECFTQKVKLVEGAPNFNTIDQLNVGDEATLVGAIKANHRTKKHQLYIRNGSIRVVGDIGDVGTGLIHGAPLVKIKVRVGKKALFGLGAPTYEVISCERVPQ